MGEETGGVMTIRCRSTTVAATTAASVRENPFEM